MLVIKPPIKTNNPISKIPENFHAKNPPIKGVVKNRYLYRDTFFIVL